MNVLLIILFVVLGIIALVLLLFLLVMFAPLKYRARISAVSEGGFKDLRTEIDFKGSWMFGIVRFVYTDEFIVKVLWFRILKPKPNLLEKYKGTDKTGNDLAANPVGADKSRPNNAQEKTEEENEDKPNLFEKLRAKYEDYKQKFDDIKAKYDFVMNHPSRKEIQPLLVEFAKKEWLVFKPGTFRVSGTLGLGEPDKTGVAVGAICALSGLTGLYVRVDGDFEGQSLNITAVAADKLRLFHAAYPLVRLVSNKKVRSVLFQYLRKR